MALGQKFKQGLHSDGPMKSHTPRLVHSAEYGLEQFELEQATEALSGNYGRQMFVS